MEKTNEKDFMENKFHNPEWWDNANYADDPNKKPSKQYLEQLKKIMNRAKKAGVKLP